MSSPLSVPQLKCSCKKKPLSQCIESHKIQVIYICTMNWITTLFKSKCPVTNNAIQWIGTIQNKDVQVIIQHTSIWLLLLLYFVARFHTRDVLHTVLNIPVKQCPGFAQIFIYSKMSNGLRFIILLIYSRKYEFQCMSALSLSLFLLIFK